MNDLPRNGYKLTFRQLQVVELLAFGYSAKEAACRLNIAPRTIEQHIENVRLKLGARNRVHLITLAVLTGALELTPLEVESGSDAADSQLHLPGFASLGSAGPARRSQAPDRMDMLQ